MYCRNCGSPIPDSARFCPKCGARSNDLEAGTAVGTPESPEKKPRKKHKAVKTLCLIFLIPFLLILTGVIGLTVYSLLTQPDPEDFVIVSEASGNDMLLWADRTDFILTGQEEDIHTVHLTVHNPAGDLVEVKDEDGTVLLTLTSENLDEAGDWSADVDFTFTEPRTIRLTATSGRTESLPLLLYAAPEITFEMVAECSQIGVELGEYLQSKGYEPADYNQKALELAADWLEEDDRISEIAKTETMIYYVTEQSVVGCWTLPPAKNSFGSETFSDSGAPTYYFENWENQIALDHPYIYSENTLVNDRIIILLPLYGKDWKCSNTDYYKTKAQKIAKAMNRDANIGVYDDIDAVNQINNQSLSNAGIIIFNTHGGCNSFVDSSGQEQMLWNFYLYKSSLDDARSVFNQLTEIELDRTGLSENYQMFYGNTSSFHNNLEQIRLCIDRDFIHGTSNYLMNLYQNVTFDNAVIYFGICDSTCDQRLIRFFLSHGAVSYSGYRYTIACNTEKNTFQKWADELCTMISKEQRLKTVQESSGTDLGFFSNISRSIDKKYNEFMYDAKDQYCYHTINRNHFTLYGYGTLEGDIKIKDDAESPKGTTVRLYRYINQTFENTDEITVKKDGHFSFTDLPWGVYVVTAEKNDYQTAKRWLIFQSKKQDGGEILLKPDNFTVSLLWQPVTEIVSKSGATISKLYGFYPEITFPGEKNAMGVIQDTLEKNAKLSVKSYLDSYDSLTDQDVEYYKRWGQFDSYSLLPVDGTRMDQSVISIAYQETQCAAGSAHVNHWFHSFNFDPKTGDLLELSDILAGQDAYSKLGHLVYEGTPLDCQEAEEREYLAQNAWDSWNSHTPGDNPAIWYFTHDGLGITYDPYEIAPYAAGSTTWEIPYSQLEGIVKDYYLTPGKRSDKGQLLDAEVVKSVTVDASQETIFYEGPGDGTYMLSFCPPETVYDVAIYEVTGARENWLNRRPMVTINALSSDTAVIVCCGESSPDSPNLFARWIDGTGKECQAYYSVGGDGELTVIPDIAK